jgi:hypothetical protein
VENIGDGEAQGSFVTVLKVSKDGSGFAELARFTRTSLDKGKLSLFFKDVKYASVRSVRFMIVADATNVIHERNQTNNTVYSETIKPQITICKLLECGLRLLFGDSSLSHYCWPDEAAM